MTAISRLRRRPPHGTHGGNIPFNRSHTNARRKRRALNAQY